MNRRNRKTAEQEKSPLDTEELKKKKQNQKADDTVTAQETDEEQIRAELEAQAKAIEKQAEALFEEEKQLSDKNAKEKDRTDDTADSHAAKTDDKREKAEPAVPAEASLMTARNTQTMNNTYTDSQAKLALDLAGSLRRRVNLLTLALICAAGLAGYGAYYMHEHRYDTITDYETRMSQNSDRIEKTYAEIQKLHSEVMIKDERIDLLLTENNELKSQNNALNTRISELSSKVDLDTEAQGRINARLDRYESRDPNDWLVAKSYFLISNAQNLLQSTDSISAAVLNLTQAEQMLVNIEDPNIVKVRDAVFSDVQTLKSIQPVDVRGIASRLDSVLSNIDGMPLNEFLESNIRKDIFKKKDEVTEDIRDWKQNLISSLKGFSARFIEIRRRDEAIVNQFLSPEQTGILAKNLKTQLLLAKVALYQQDEEAFRHNIGEVITSIESYYDTQNATVSANLESLVYLAQCTIVLAKPESLKSYALISEVAREKFRIYDAARAKETSDRENEASQKAQQEAKSTSGSGDRKKK